MCSTINIHSFIDFQKFQLKFVLHLDGNLTIVNTWGAEKNVKQTRREAKNKTWAQSENVTIHLEKVDWKRLILLCLYKATASSQLAYISKQLAWLCPQITQSANQHL